MSAAGIFSLCDPTTVGGPIGPIIVDAVDRQSLPIAIVECPLLEAGKGLPFVADVDAAPAIAMEAAMSRVRAALSHAVPDPGEIGFRCAMSGVRVDAQAATGFSFSDAQTAPANDVLVAAVTAAQPSGLATWITLRSSDDAQTSEPPTCQVGDFSHEASPCAGG